MIGLWKHTNKDRGGFISVDALLPEGGTRGSAPNLMAINPTAGKTVYLRARNVNVQPLGWGLGTH